MAKDDDIFAQIETFYRDVIKLPIPEYPQRLTANQKASAVEHWQEEIAEFEAAETLEDEIDAALDLAWLAIGRVIEMGAPAADHMQEIVRANMDRVPGRNEKRPLSTGYDAVKPEGWIGPKHHHVLCRHIRALIEERLHMRHENNQASDESFKLVSPQPSVPEGVPAGTIAHYNRWPMAPYSCVTGGYYIPAAVEVTGVDSKEFHSLTTRRPLILVGHGRHGKDTVAEMLRDQYGLQFTASSSFCAEKVMIPAFQHPHATPKKDYPSVQACFDDRHNHRAFWFDSIAAYNTPDKAKLAKEIFAAGNDLYVGVRDFQELFAIKLNFPEAIVIWVDASKRLEREDTSSMNIGPWMADIYLDNNGDLATLAANVALLAKNLNL